MIKRTVVTALLFLATFLFGFLPNTYMDQSPVSTWELIDMEDLSSRFDLRIVLESDHNGEVQVNGETKKVVWSTIMNECGESLLCLDGEDRDIYCREFIIFSRNGIRTLQFGPLYFVEVTYRDK